MRITLLFVLSAIAGPALCHAAPWQAVNNGLPGHSVGTLVGDDNGNVYALTGRGLYRSSDAGDTWSRLDPTLGVDDKHQLCPAPSATPFTSAFEAPTGCYNMLAHTSSIVVDPAHAEHLYVTAGGRIHVSTDGGRIWAILPAALELPQYQHRMVMTAQPHRIYAGADQSFGALTEVDGRWSRVALKLEGLDTRGLNAIAVNPTHPMTVFVTTVKGVFVSRDGGDHFIPIGSWSHDRVTAIALDPGDSQKVIVSTALGTQKSSDGGISWQPVGAQSTSLRGVGSFVFLKGTRTAFAAAADALWRSDDGGDTWSMLDGTRGQRWLSLVAEAAHSTLLAERADGHFRSNDGGATLAK